MILISILLMALLIATITVILGVCFGYTKNRTLRTVFRIAVCAAVFCGVFCFVLGGIWSNDIADLKATHADLALYQPLIEDTSNEYIRYDFYEKVTEYNDGYREMLTNSKSKWFGALVAKDWNADIGTIEFYLHGSE